jgi:hypothetical protein
MSEKSEFALPESEYAAALDKAPTRSQITAYKQWQLNERDAIVARLKDESERTALIFALYELYKRNWGTSTIFAAYMFPTNEMIARWADDIITGRYAGGR